jgi:hypothetical protein
MGRFAQEKVHVALTDHPGFPRHLRDEPVIVLTFDARDHIIVHSGPAGIAAEYRKSAFLLLAPKGEGSGNSNT